MTTDERHILQPTYQSVLIQALSDVIFRMNNNDVFGTFNALETLYIMLPPDCTTETTQTHDKIIEQILHTEGAKKAIDIAITQMNLTNWKRRFLYQCNRTLLRTYKESLNKHGYLDISRGRPPTKESDIQTIGEKLQK